MRFEVAAPEENEHPCGFRHDKQIYAKKNLVGKIGLW
jgi:hypothetical protein